MVQFYSIDSEDEETHQQHADHPDGMALVVDRDHHSTGIRMTPKVPPTFDGQSSWFEFEDLIDDWMGITTLTPERLGPSLKNALVGAAEFYKNMLNNADLRHPENGVRHFKDTLRPYFVKGVNHVFLWRFLQLFRCYRGNQEFVLWIGRFEVTSRRVLTAWMDLFHHDIPEVTTVEFFALLNPAVRQQINEALSENSVPSKACCIRGYDSRYVSEVCFGGMFRGMFRPPLLTVYITVIKTISYLKKLSPTPRWLNDQSLHIKYWWGHLFSSIQFRFYHIKTWRNPSFFSICAFGAGITAFRGIFDFQVYCQDSLCAAKFGLQLCGLPFSSEQLGQIRLSSGSQWIDGTLYLISPAQQLCVDGILLWRFLAKGNSPLWISFHLQTGKRFDCITNDTVRKNKILCSNPITSKASTCHAIAIFDAELIHGNV